MSSSKLRRGISRKQINFPTCEDDDMMRRGYSARKQTRRVQFYVLRAKENRYILSSRPGVSKLVGLLRLLAAAPNAKGAEGGRSILKVRKTKSTAALSISYCSTIGRATPLPWYNHPAEASAHVAPGGARQGPKKTGKHEPTQ